MRNSEIQIFKSAVHNLLNAEIIPKDAYQDAQNWYTQDGRVKLISGKVLIGQSGAVGAVEGGIFGYKADGTTVHWRKTGTKIQYFDGSTWADVVTGLTDGADYWFTNYSSLAGTFTFAFGIDGIYKMHNANPGSYNSMYNASINFKGFAFIDKGRTILWNRKEDKTGIYGSYIDNQREISGATGVYTSVTGEATTSLAGTLAFKATGATRNCFNVMITITASGEVYTDSYTGTLTGSLGGTGTINYITGTYTLSNPGVGTVNYQWEDSNTRGVTDFTKSSPRVASQGFQFPQDEGGDPILNVLVGQDGAYYSIKQSSAYKLTIDATDTNATNEIYRKELGLPSNRAATSTGKGIVFLNTANPEKPELTILEKNLTGDNVEPKVLCGHFKFSNYVYNDCTIDNYDRYILIACKSENAVNNDTILLCDISLQTVDILNYSGRIFTRDNGLLYMGSSLAQNTYNLFSGFDDDGDSIDNFVTTKDELFDVQNLKKYRRIRLKGSISFNQGYEVYVNYDNQGDQLVGTVLGTGSYVDYNSPQTIGSNIIGTSQIGGNDLVDVYDYFCEIMLKKVPKFRKRSLTFKAIGIGYVDINYQQDWDLSVFDNRLPSRFRQKQNVSMNGETENLPNPEF